MSARNGLPELDIRVWDSLGRESGLGVESDDLTCDIEDCGGTQYVVTWPDGERTQVCAQGLSWIGKDEVRIIGCPEAVRHD
jgi:hypothetical protein